MTSISLLASKPTTIDTTAFCDMDARRRVQAGLVLQMVPGFLLAGVASIALARIGDAAAAILADGNDDDHTGAIAQLVNTNEFVFFTSDVLQSKADAILEADHTGILDAYSNDDLMRMSGEIGSIAASLQAWRILIDDADSASDEFVVEALATAKRAVATIEQTIGVAKKCARVTTAAV